MAVILWEHAAVAQVDARQRAPRLERSRRDRWIAGVAGGIAHHLGVQPSIVRIAFVVSSFAAGFGLVVYVLTWLLAPLETSSALKNVHALVRSRVRALDEDRAPAPDIAVITELIASNELENSCGARVK